MERPKSLPVIYHAPWGRYFWLMNVSMLCGGLSIFAIGDNAWLGGLMLATFVSLALWAGFRMGPPLNYLELTTSGFRFKRRYRKHTVAWSEVKVFFPTDEGWGGTVGWHWVDGHPGHDKLKETTLPNSYGHSHLELADLMNELRQKWGHS